MVQVLQSLRTSVTSSGNPLSEAEMDRHTLKGLREGGFRFDDHQCSSKPLLTYCHVDHIWAATSGIGRRKMHRHVLNRLYGLPST